MTRQRRRLPRILLNAVTAASLALCVATLGLWCRSHVTQDDAGFAEAYVSADTNKPHYSSRLIHVESSHGKLDLELFYRFVPLPSRLPADATPPIYVDAKMLMPPHLFRSSRPVSAVSDLTGLTSEIHRWGPVEWAWFDIGDPTPQIGGLYEQDRDLRLPHWVLVLLLGFLPARRGWKVARNRHRAGCIERSLCPACGYDLRATPDRCPECGAVPVAPPA